MMIELTSQTGWGNIREPLRGPQVALHLNIHPALHLEYAKYELESLAALRAASIQEAGVQRLTRCTVCSQHQDLPPEVYK